VAVVPPFRALAGSSTWSTDRLGAWLFTGTASPGRKRSAYWSAKVRDLMAWLSLLAGRSIHNAVWDGPHRLPPWPTVFRNIEQADPTTPHQWVTAFRPLVEMWCSPPHEPRMEDDIITLLCAPPPPPDAIRRSAIGTRIARLLHRGLEYAYRTRPGHVEPWMENRARQEHRPLKEPPNYGHTWYRGRLYDMKTRRVLYTRPKARSLYSPEAQEEVITRFFKYAGIFVSLGIATHDPARPGPVGPLPQGRSLPLTCRFCHTLLQAAIIDAQPKVWCPHCFVEVYELIPAFARYNERRKRFELITP
jgi:hypothetical protein